LRARDKRGIIAERDALLAGVIGHKENMKQSVAISLSLPQIFFVSVHFRMRN